MIFGHFLTDVNESNCFIVACDATKEAILIDAGEMDIQVTLFLRNHALNLEKVFITHDHYDHTGGLTEIVAQFNPRIYAARARVAGHNARKVAHGDTITVGHLAGTVLSTPGHTPDSLCITFPGMVFTGDTLFAGSIGGTSTPDEEIRYIREHIFSLPLDYEVHTGHGPSSTVLIESRSNPFFI